MNIIARVRGSGTFVKESVPRRPAGCSVGLISTYFSDYIFPHILTGVESVLSDAGLPMQLAITHNLVSEETNALNNMISSGVSGLIVEPSKSALPNPNMELYRKLREDNIPLVFFNAKYPWADFPLITMNDESAGRMMTDHLFDMGHTKISGIFVLDDIQGHKRYRGFMNSFLAHGRNDAEQNVLWYEASEMNDLFTFGRRKLQDLIANSTAVVCYNDMLAVNFLCFCRENSIRVPEDLSVVGIDDSKYSSLCDVPLTTARHPQNVLGQAAGELIIKLMNEPSSQVNDVIFEPELVVRDSVRNMR
jgi:GntR family transcriptional regulator of arabinose operon